MSTILIGNCRHVLLYTYHDRMTDVTTIQVCDLCAYPITCTAVDRLCYYTGRRSLDYAISSLRNEETCKTETE